MFNFIKGFFCIYWYDHATLSFILFMCYIIFIDLLLLRHPYILGMKQTWSCIYLICCWIQFVSILLSVLQIYLPRLLTYSLIVASLPGFGR
jgi:hypothetical protein